VTDGQTDGRTVALVDAGGAVMRRRSVAGTDEARELCLIRLVSASLAVLTDLRHHVEERSRRTRHCNHTTSPHRPRGGEGRDDIPSPADNSSTVAYRFVANQAIVDPKIAADLRPSADGSAVRTSLVAGGG